jgi:hypothetical protein
MQLAQIGFGGGIVLPVVMLLGVLILITLAFMVFGLLFGLVARLFECFGKFMQVLAALSACCAFACLGASLGGWAAFGFPLGVWYYLLIPLAGAALGTWSITVVYRKHQARRSALQRSPEFRPVPTIPHFPSRLDGPV